MSIQSIAQVLSENISSSIKPNQNKIISILDELKKVIFPLYYDKTPSMIDLEGSLCFIKSALTEEIQNVIACQGLDNSGKLDAASILIERLPEIRDMLSKDVEAGFNGDPAAKSYEDIILSYPGIYAIFVYRIAHVLYEQKIPIIPRMMTEHAHTLTGIDINPGALIGEYFFIDHGTGVVIGETTIIGSRVKLYQGVTLGALSTRKGQMLSGIKRHPTIEDNVTIYANASIFGGDTVIGANSIIGGGAFVTQSVPGNTKVIVKNQQLILKDMDGKVWEI